MATKRHKWGEPLRDIYLTTRVCIVCSLRKVTHHEGVVFPWVTYHFGEGEKEPAMPQCELA